MRFTRGKQQQQHQQLDCLPEWDEKRGYCTIADFANRMGGQCVWLNAGQSWDTAAAAGHSLHWRRECAHFLVWRCARLEWLNLESHSRVMSLFGHSFLLLSERKWPLFFFFFFLCFEMREKCANLDSSVWVEWNAISSSFLALCKMTFLCPLHFLAFLPRSILGFQFSQLQTKTICPVANFFSFSPALCVVLMLAAGNLITYCSKR